MASDRSIHDKQEHTVADEATKISGPFDVQMIKRLIALMSRHDLSEIDLQEGVQRIRLRRGQKRASVMPVVQMPTAAAAPVPAAVPVPTMAGAAESPQPAARPGLTIKSPTPGTYYSSPSPDAPPFVRVGSKVTPTTVVCLIEAMKTFNEIPAECSGVITEILVDNQQPVEYGQVLFKVDPAG